MFLVQLHYTDIRAIDGLIEQHYTSPDGPFGRGLVRLAGRLEPRTGGVMVLDGGRAEVEAAVAADPFVAGGAATATILEFHRTYPAPGQPAAGSRR